MIGVVVAGAQVAVAADHAVFVAADQQGQLAVGLEADDAVEDLYAGVFEARAQRMLEASSKRAVSSTTTVTSLLAAASVRARKMGESELVR